MRGGLVLCAVLLAACGAPAPEPAVVEAPTPQPEPVPEPVPVTAPAPVPAPVPAPDPVAEPAPIAAAPLATEKQPPTRSPAAKPATTPAAGGCELAFDARLRGRAPNFEIHVVATNRTDAELTFELPSGCPGGPIQFTGLPREYDYYVGCAKGMCFNPKPEVFTLDAHEHRVIAIATVVADGSGNCQGPLPHAVYRVRPIVPALPFKTCAGAAKLDWTGTAK